MKYLILALPLLGVFIGGIGVGTQMVAKTSHSAPQAKAAGIRTVYVYRWSPDINTLLYRGHYLCRGDMGLSAMLVFPAMPNNAEFLCAGQHEAYTEAGLRL